MVPLVENVYKSFRPCFADGCIRYRLIAPCRYTVILEHLTIVSYFYNCVLQKNSTPIVKSINKTKIFNLTSKFGHYEKTIKLFKQPLLSVFIHNEYLYDLITVLKHCGYNSTDTKRFITPSTK